jgi:phage terminase small subunit
MKGMGDTSAKPLTPREEAFCLAFLTAESASEAFREAYPHSKRWKNEAVWVRASKLLARNKVQLRIESLRKRVQSPKVLEVRQALDVLTAMVLANVEDYFDHQTGRIDIRRGAPQAVESFSETVSKDGTRTVKFKLANKQGAVQKIADILGWDAPKKFQPGDGVVFNLNLGGDKAHE